MYLYLQLILFIFYNILIDPILTDIDRKLQTKILAPNNESICSNITCNNVIYTQAIGLNDTLHYLYTTRGPPSILIVKTSLTSKLNIDWKVFLSPANINKSITFENGSIFDASVLSFQRLFEYNDLSDDADLTKPTGHILSTNLSNVSWENASLSSNLISFSTNLSKSSKSKLTILMQASGSSGLSSHLPHMNLNSNLTLIDVLLSNLTAFNSSSHLRLALELRIATSQTKGESAVIVDRTLDDEQTPGAFQIMNLETNTKNTSESFFLQWKPICYTTEEKTVKAVSAVKYYQIEQNLSISSFPSLERAFFGDSHTLQILAVNLSFGATGDKFYPNTNFVTWTFTYGWGDRPQASISTSIILIIVLGLGVPAVIVLLGWIYLAFHKSKARRGYIDITSSYPPI